MRDFPSNSWVKGWVAHIPFIYIYAAENLKEKRASFVIDVAVPLNSNTIEKQQEKNPELRPWRGHGDYKVDPDVIGGTGLVKKDLHKALKTIDLRAWRCTNLSSMQLKYICICSSQNPIRYQYGQVGSVFNFHCLDVKWNGKTSPFMSCFKFNNNNK